MKPGTIGDESEAMEPLAFRTTLRDILISLNVGNAGTLLIGLPAASTSPIAKLPARVVADPHLVIEPKVKPKLRHNVKKRKR
jgi:hypothetical protein